jgi:hypothetical protein
VAWLTAMGAGNDLGEDDGTAAAAATAAPSEPAGDPSGVWTSWREENKLAGGRRVRSFYLLDAGGHKARECKRSAAHSTASALARALWQLISLRITAYLRRWCYP